MRFSTFSIVALSGLILVLAVLLAIGCGGGDDNGSGGSQNAAQSANATQANDSQDGDGAPESSESGSGDSESAESDGSGDSGSGEAQSAAQSSGKPLSKPAFIKQGDAVCAGVPTDFQSRLQSLEKEKEEANQPKATTAEIAEKAAIPPLYTAAVKLEELVPPSGDEQEAEAIIAALEKAAEGLEANPNAEFSGPKSPFAEFQALTKKYGFKTCNQL